ncbi:hypothetical protein [Pseudoalteromonas sp. MTN2-4]|uniref:hypothetical protein n=1 Tax=Pseudoalteromonas sp. MTN2-4 TaxID=3056555 RepID=UPI0036F2BFFD
MIKQLLISTLLFISFLSFGKDKLEVIGCWDTGSALCSQVSKQREYSRFLAENDAPEALLDSDSAILNYVIQSDTSNTVTHFKFHVYKDQEWAEGPDGQDILHPVTRIRFISETGIHGAAKADIERAVSPRVATEQFIEKYSNKEVVQEYRNRALNDLGSEVIVDEWGFIDYDTTCGQEGAPLEREPSKMRQHCNDFVAKVNRPLHFSTPDGYRITLYSNPRGKVEVVEFYLPNGIKIPVDSDGTVKLKGAAEELLSGRHNVTKDHLAFIQLLNKRIDHLVLRRLEALLNAGLQCDRCTVTIVDEMTE